MRPTLNVEDLVRDHGGVASLVEKFTGEGQPVQRKTVEKWRERNRVPGWAIIVLARIHRLDRSVAQLEEYVMNTGDGR